MFSPYSIKPTQLIRLPPDGEMQGARCTDLRADPLFPAPLRIGESEYLEASQWEVFLAEIMVRGSQEQRGFFGGLAAIGRPSSAEQPAPLPSATRPRQRKASAAPA